MAQNINLNSLSRNTRRDLFTGRGVALIALALLTGQGVLGWSEKSRTATLLASAASDKALSDRLQRQLQEMPKDATQSNELVAEERDIRALEAVAARLNAGVLGRSGSFTDALKGFGRATHEGVWLTHIKLHQGTGRIVLEGKALDAGRVPALMAALGTQPQFSGTAFAQLEITHERSQADHRTVQFRITSTESINRLTVAQGSTQTTPSPSIDEASNSTTIQNAGAGTVKGTL